METHHVYTVAMFTEEPLTVGQMLDLTQANDPAVSANPTLQAMMRLMLARYRGPVPMTFDRLRALPYTEFVVLYKEMLTRIPKAETQEIPRPFIEGMGQ